MPLLTFYNPEEKAQSKSALASDLSPFTLLEDTTTMADLPAGAHPLAVPIVLFRGMDRIFAWKCWTTPTTVFDSFNHNLAAIPKSPGILGFLFFHWSGFTSRTQWYGEDTYTMWDGTVLNGRSIAQAAYDNWMRQTVYNDETWP